jgi:hypothetical protein
LTFESEQALLQVLDGTLQRRDGVENGRLQAPLILEVRPQRSVEQPPEERDRRTRAVSVLHCAPRQRGWRSLLWRYPYTK